MCRRAFPRIAGGQYTRFVGPLRERFKAEGSVLCQRVVPRLFLCYVFACIYIASRPSAFCVANSTTKRTQQ